VASVIDIETLHGQRHSLLYTVFVVVPEPELT